MTSVRRISERRPKSDPFVFIRLFRVRGPILGKEGGGHGGTKRGGASCRVANEWRY